MNNRVKDTEHWFAWNDLLKINLSKQQNSWKWIFGLFLLILSNKWNFYLDLDNITGGAKKQFLVTLVTFPYFVTLFTYCHTCHFSHRRVFSLLAYLVTLAKDVQTCHFMLHLSCFVTLITFCHSCQVLSHFSCFVTFVHFVTLVVFVTLVILSHLSH